MNGGGWGEDWGPGGRPSWGAARAAAGVGGSCSPLWSVRVPALSGLLCPHHGCRVEASCSPTGGPIPRNSKQPGAIYHDRCH